MSAEEFFDRIRRLVSLKSTFQDVECVDDARVYLDTEARVRGWATLPDRTDSAAFDHALVDHNTTLDARTADLPLTADGGDLEDPSVTVEFSEKN